MSHRELVCLTCGGTLKNPTRPGLCPSCERKWNENNIRSLEAFEKHLRKKGEKR